MESSCPSESYLTKSTSQSLVKSRPNPLTTFTNTTTHTTTTTTTVVVSSNILNTPTTPRIDISRASSSSHHDSRDSSPENVFDQVGKTYFAVPLFILYITIT